MKRLSALLALVVGCLVLGACAHPAAKPIKLPTVTAVKAPVVAAKASNARAVALAAKVAKEGTKAGSADAQALVLSTAATDSQLADALTKIDALSAQLLAAQKTVDKQTDTLAWYTAKYDEAVKALWWYRVRFWGPLAMAIIAAAIWLLTRFTSWGASTFGPYILGVEKVAAKAATVAAIA